MNHRQLRLMTDLLTKLNELHVRGLDPMGIVAITDANGDVVGTVEFESGEYVLVVPVS